MTVADQLRAAAAALDVQHAATDAHIAVLEAQLSEARKQLGAEQAADAPGTIVPLYTFPTHASWNALIAAKQAHPTVRVVAIVNPASGPGAARNNEYTKGINRLVAAGVTVIGYVHTEYGTRSLSTVQAEITAWAVQYPAATGIFLDEMASKAGSENYYNKIVAFAKAKGMPFTVGNPGTGVSETYIGIVDTIMIFESAGVPALSRISQFDRFENNNFAIIPYATGMDAAFVAEARKHVGWIYLQSDTKPNPWDSLPAYFGELLKALE